MKIKAFTLIETILYLALFNVIFFAVITWAIALSQNNRSAEYKNSVEKSSIFVTEHLADTFRKGISIDNTNSTFENTSGKVRILLTTGYLEYHMSGQTLQVYNGTSTFDLTDKFVQVTNFTVSPVIVLPSTITGVKVRITISAIKFPNITKTVESYYAFR